MKSPLEAALCSVKLGEVFLRIPGLLRAQFIPAPPCLIGEDAEAQRWVRACSGSHSNSWQILDKVKQILCFWCRVFPSDPNGLPACQLCLNQIFRRCRCLLQPPRTQKIPIFQENLVPHPPSLFWHGHSTIHPSSPFIEARKSPCVALPSSLLLHLRAGWPHSSALSSLQGPLLRPWNSPAVSIPPRHCGQENRKHLSHPLSPGPWLSGP